MGSGAAGSSTETNLGPRSSHQQSHPQWTSSSRSQLDRAPPRTFAIGPIRIQCTRQRVLDAIVDFASYSVEGLVYVIGPLLIFLALAIISFEAYTFFNVLLPMMHDKHAGNPYRTGILMAHSFFTVFVIYNIIFNYACGVLQKHTGPPYDQVVAELAEATEFHLPRTPEEIAIFRQELNDRLVIRMRRRNMGETATIHTTDDTNAVGNAPATKRRHNGRSDAGSNVDSTASSTTPQQAAHQSQSSSNTAVASGGSTSVIPKVRSWMLMGPFEWGYCANCKQPKPPRSHFDHVSKALVLNLDHYCPWMFNSIGYFNYRYFVNFLIYIVVGMAYGTAIMWEPFMLSKSLDYRRQIAMHRAALKHGLPLLRIKPMMPLRDEKLAVTLSFMLCVAVGLSVFLLGAFHLFLTLTAQTTIEFQGNLTQRKRARAAGQKWKNPYSRGSWRSNWEQVYGTQYSWLLFSLLPSRREPEFLPAPVPGNPRRRAKASVLTTSENDSERGESCELSPTAYESDRLLPATVTSAV